MVLEVVQIKIKPGTDAEFEAAFAKTLELYGRARGWRNSSLHRSIEHANRYVLFVEWDTIDDHVVGFRESADFTKFRELVGPFFDGAPEVEHVETIIAHP